MLGVKELELGGSISDDLTSTSTEALIRRMPGGYNQKKKQAIEQLRIASKKRHSVQLDIEKYCYSMDLNILRGILHRFRSRSKK